MTTTTAPESAPPSRPTLNRGAAFALVALVITTLLGASAAPTPLYEMYQENWGFSSLQSTLVFGIYAMSLLVALLTVGSLSDHVGRRPVLITALGLGAVAMIMFASAEGVGLLLIARVVQGLATGAAISALGSTLLDLERAPGRGATVNSIAPAAGLALGAIGSSLVSEHLPRPTVTVYLVFLTLFVIEAVGVWAAPETAARQPGALASVRPTLAVPRAAMGMLAVTAPCLVAVWALGGFYLSLGPSLAKNALDVHSSLLGATMVALLTGTGALTVFLLRNRRPHHILIIGASALVAGVAVTLVGAETSSALAILLGTVVAGVGFGAGFQGTMHTVMPLAQPHQRAGLLSSIYVIAYLANSIPALVAGYLVGKVGLVDTTRMYGGLVMVLAGAALVGLLLRERTPATPGTMQE